MLVTISTTAAGAQGSKDYDIPSSQTASELLSQMQEQLHLRPALLARYRLRADPPGRVLEPDETLGQAGVWDGAVLSVCL